MVLDNNLCMKIIYLLSVLLFILLFSFFDKPKYSIDGFEQKSFVDLLGFMRSERGEWPTFMNVTQVKPTQLENEVKVTYVNHATFLIQLGAVNILIDPIWSEYAYPVQFTGPKRIHKPGIALGDLPPIDYVLITHNHYDHLDLGTLRSLEKAFQPQFLVGLDVDKYLVKKIHKNIKIQALNWGDSFVLDGVEFFFEKAFHWSKRSLFDYNDTLWGSFVIKGFGKTLYHAGDTGYSDHFKEIGSKYSIDFAMIPVGDYEPRWFMKQSHMNPLEAFQSMQDLGALSAVGMHFGTFQLASNSYEQVFIDFDKASAKYQSLNFVLPNVAQEFYVE